MFFVLFYFVFWVGGGEKSVFRFWFFTNHSVSQVRQYKVVTFNVFLPNARLTYDRKKLELRATHPQGLIFMDFYSLD